MLSPNVVPEFTALRLAVVGDLIVDHYLHARPMRLSREAPVMVLRYMREVLVAGGAANAARNGWSLGARTRVLGAVGRDGDGRELLRLLERSLIDVEDVETLEEWTTPTKTRVLGADPGRTVHQVLRIDREPDGPPAPAVRAQLATRVRALAGEVDALLVSDYGYGLVDSEVAAAASEVAASGATVVLDPRRQLDGFRGLTGMTPNLAELAEITGRTLDQLESPAEVASAAHELLERVQPEWLLVTLGNQGMQLFSRDEREGIPVGPSGSEAVVDVSGAGDTAAAAFTLALAAGLEGPRAMRLANASAGVVVMEPGTAVCELSKLRSALPHAPRPQLTRAPVPR